MNSLHSTPPATRPISVEVFNSVQGGAFFQRLLQEWRKAETTVIAHEGISEDGYRCPRSFLGRMALRWRMYIGYAATCWRAARVERLEPSVRVVATNPFFAPALVKWASGSNGSTINLLYDLFPDALVQSGAINSSSWIAQSGAAITRFSLRNCDATVFLGERLRRHAEAAYGPVRRSVVVPVGADGVPFRDSPPQLLAPDIVPTILYCGQMGRMHETKTVSSFWREGGPQRVRWLFHASGNGYSVLKKNSGLIADVEWGGPLHDAAWQQAMKLAQVAFVTIASGAERVVMPSKTYSALVAGQAIVAICSRESDLSDLILQHDCGWVVEPGDVAGLRRAIGEIAHDPDQLFAKRRNAYNAGHDCYDMAKIATQWQKLFVELSDGPTSAGSGNARCRAA